MRLRRKTKSSAATEELSLKKPPPSVVDGGYEDGDGDVEEVEDAEEEVERCIDSPCDLWRNEERHKVTEPEEGTQQMELGN